MAEFPIRREIPEQTGEAVDLEGHYRAKNKFLALFLISCAVLIAGFAMTALWGNGGMDWLIPSSGEETQTDDTDEGTGETDTTAESAQEENPDEPSIPMDATPIISLDLSCADRYINNESIQAPNIGMLLEKNVSSTVTDQPLVLILHTHTTESYLSSPTEYLVEPIGSVTYSQNEEVNVVSVGSVLCETLNRQGIPTLHCKTVHDGDADISAYRKAEESIRFFLSHYPSIRYVIDLHRDSILTERGEYVRAVAEPTGEPVAQVMCVVGSDGNGIPCENWRDNLALALQLRESLNDADAHVSRPVTLRNATYNQELAPYALLLEIGTGANTVEEAKRAAVRVGECLARLIRE